MQNEAKAKTTKQNKQENKQEAEQRNKHNRYWTVSEKHALPKTSCIIETVFHSKN